MSFPQQKIRYSYAGKLTITQKWTKSDGLLGLALYPTFEVIVERLVHQIIIQGHFIAHTIIRSHAGAFGHVLQLFANKTRVNVVVILIQINGFISIYYLTRFRA
jgi:hypothetical protein